MPKKRKRTMLKKFFHVMSFVLPFFLPILVLVLWFYGRTNAEESDVPLHIFSSIDSETGYTSFSTILPDGNEAVWTCSEGLFDESGTMEAAGRTVNWSSEADIADSVLITILTPTVLDSLKFLPMQPDLTPIITVSASYHLVILDRSRSVQLAAGTYNAICTADNLHGYDGLALMIIKPVGSERYLTGILPGDTVSIVLPLGGTVIAAGIDTIEEAIDNSGNVHITFEVLPPADFIEADNESNSTNLAEPKEESE